MKTRKHISKILAFTNSFRHMFTKCLFWNISTESKYTMRGGGAVWVVVRASWVTLNWSLFSLCSRQTKVNFMKIDILSVFSYKSSYWIDIEKVLNILFVTGFFSSFCVQSKLDELRGHKTVPANILPSYSMSSFSVMRGGRPATTTSRPSHILLIFSSKPPQNPRPSIINYYVSKSFLFL